MPSNAANTGKPERTIIKLLVDKRQDIFIVPLPVIPDGKPHVNQAGANRDSRTDESWIMGRDD